MRCEPADAQDTQVFLSWCCNLPLATLYHAYQDARCRHVRAPSTKSCLAGTASLAQSMNLCSWCAPTCAQMCRIIAVVVLRQCCQSQPMPAQAVPRACSKEVSKDRAICKPCRAHEKLPGPCQRTRDCQDRLLSRIKRFSPHCCVCACAASSARPAQQVFNPRKAALRCALCVWTRTDGRPRQSSCRSSNGLRVLIGRW